eukprot:257842-Lingulodinium_polyedra.AAC.1
MAIVWSVSGCPTRLGPTPRASKRQQRRLPTPNANCAEAAQANHTQCFSYAAEVQPMKKQQRYYC